MFVYPTIKVDVTQRVVATLVACAVVMATIGFYNTAQAANLTNVSNTLTDSNPSSTSGHEIDFTIPSTPTASSLVATDTVTIEFPAGFTGVGSITAVTVTVDGVSDPATGISVTGQELSFAGIDAAAGQEVKIVVADGIVTNPAKVDATEGVGDSYEFTITTDAASVVKDSGKTRVVIVENVLVTAIVSTTFDFVVSALASAEDVNGETTTDASTATEIPFGELVVGTAKVIGQQLNVTTNALGGFVVTVRQDADLLSSTGANIDSFIEGAYTDTPAAWSVPSNTLGSPNTYGHWGLTSEDSDLNGDEFGAQLFVAASTTPREIFSHTSVTDGTTADIGQTQVAYRIEIGSLQEAGDDYNTTLTYIATPTF